MWDWAVTISHSFSQQAHDDLYRTGLQRYLPKFFEEVIREAHAAVFEVMNRVRQARARHIFNASYRDDGAELNEALYAETRELLPALLATLQEADRVVDRSNLPWFPADGGVHPRPRRGRIRRAAGRLHGKAANV